MLGKKCIILPLDVPSREKALALAALLKDDVGAFKIGLELINAAGLGILDEVAAATGKHVFYDCKMMDIPQTITGAAKAIVREHDIWMFNVHCFGGFKMMKAAKDASVEEAKLLGKTPPLVIGVTVLTSIDDEILNDDLRVPGPTLEEVVHLAKLAQKAGLDGVVCSPKELKAVRAAFGENFLIVTPGVRPAGADVGDQMRPMTPGEAFDEGARHLVIGTPIIKAEDPKAAAQAIASEIEDAYYSEILARSNTVLTDIHVVLTPKEGIPCPHSGSYANKDSAGKNYPDATELYEGLAQPLLGKNVEVIAGPAAGAISFVHGVARYISEMENRPVVAVFCEPSDPTQKNGPMVFKRGYAADIKGKLVGVIEDIFSSGGSAKRTIEAIRDLDPEDIVAVSGLLNRGEVTSIDLWDVPIYALVNRKMPHWDVSECQLCKDNVPMRVDIGKGKEWLETDEGKAWLEQGGSIAP